MFLLLRADDLGKLLLFQYFIFLLLLSVVAGAGHRKPKQHNLVGEVRSISRQPIITHTCERARASKKKQKGNQSRYLILTHTSLRTTTPQKSPATQLFLAAPALAITTTAFPPTTQFFHTPPPQIGDVFHASPASTAVRWTNDGARVSLPSSFSSSAQLSRPSQARGEKVKNLATRFESAATGQVPCRLPKGTSVSEKREPTKPRIDRNRRKLRIFPQDSPFFLCAPLCSSNFPQRDQIVEWECVRRRSAVVVVRRSTGCAMF